MKNNYVFDVYKKEDKYYFVMFPSNSRYNPMVRSIDYENYESATKARKEFVGYIKDRNIDSHNSPFVTIRSVFNKKNKENYEVEYHKDGNVIAYSKLYEQKPSAKKAITGIFNHIDAAIN